MKINIPTKVTVTLKKNIPGMKKGESFEFEFDLNDWGGVAGFRNLTSKEIEDKLLEDSEDLEHMILPDNTGGYMINASTVFENSEFFKCEFSEYQPFFITDDEDEIEINEDGSLDIMGEYTIDAETVKQIAEYIKTKG